MTKPEDAAAFNAGVRAVLDLSTRSAEAMSAITILKPTRYNFAAEALLALAQEGRALLKGSDGASDTQTAGKPPQRPLGGRGVELVVPAHAGDDGKFGLTDEEIIRPSREIIVGWLSGRYPMLASHWSKIAARMLKAQQSASLTSAAI